MKTYEFGNKEDPAILLLPGTCCHWRNTFGEVVPLLKTQFHAVCVSYDGFDETERTVFPSMPVETERIEQYIKEEHSGEVCAVYGCSLGGTLAAMLAARGNVKIHYCIIGSSDFDTSGRVAAKAKTWLMLKMMLPLLHTGQLPGIFRRVMEKTIKPDDLYMQKMMEMFGMGTPRPYVSKESVANQFYSDLVTILPDAIDNPDCEVHILYAKKMGRKYRKCYQKHFRNPIIHEDDLKHEELLACCPDEWVKRIEGICSPFGGKR